MKLKTRILFCLLAAALVAVGCFCPNGLAFVEGGLTLGGACFALGVLSAGIAFIDKIFLAILRDGPKSQSPKHDDELADYTERGEFSTLSDMRHRRLGDSRPEEYRHPH